MGVGDDCAVECILPRHQQFKHHEIGAQQKTGRSRNKKNKKRIEGQREMLLPIAGKKGKESAVKPVRAGGKQRKAG